MINHLTTGQRLSRDLCEMDVPQGDTIEVCPIDLSSRVDAEIKSLQQQLAEAQAACSMKDELITDACTAIAFYGEQPPQELFDALSMPCDDSTLNAWLGEPIAWRTFDGEGGYDFRSYDDNEDYRSEWDARNPNHKSWVELLYSPKGLK